MHVVQTFKYRQHAASVGLIHARMNFSEGLSDANTTLSLLVHLFPCCEGRRNISSRSCHCALWAVLRSQGRRLSMLPGGGKFCKKLKYVLAKENTACYGSIISVFTSISMYTSNSVSMLSRNLCKTWQHGFIVEIGEVYACQRPTHTSFIRHACMLIPIRKSNTRACLTV